nr:MAG TPA: hypothetical protein [Caudoviricetes sp.]
MMLHSSLKPLALNMSDTAYTSFFMKCSVPVYTAMLITS